MAYEYSERPVTEEKTESTTEYNPLKDNIIVQCLKQYEAAIKFRKFRHEDWNANEDLYFNRQKQALKSRFNVNLPIMGGFIDTLVSKTDELPMVNFNHLSDATIRAAKKNTGYWEFDSSSIRANWAGSDRDAKKMAGLYGRAIYFNYAESDPKYRSYRELVDVYDFFIDPLGGKYTENARFLGQDNVFKTLYEFEDSDLYDQSQVAKLKSSITQSESQATSDTQEEKKNRLGGLGITGEWKDYTGDPLYRVIQMGTIYQGKRYWVVFNPDHKTWLRVAPLKEVFEADLWPWTSWATHPDPFNFWSKSPADDIRSGIEAIKVLFNQSLDNRQKKNWNQRAYDSNVFKDPTKLLYRPEGLVPVTVPEGKKIGDSIYEFRVGSIDDTVTLVQIIDNILGTKTGITASAQGQTDKDAKVGIYYGDMKQVSDRMGLYNKNYSEELEQGALLWSWGIWEHLPESEMVKVVGDKGVEWDHIRKEDTSPDFAISIKGGAMEAQIDELKKKNKNEALLAFRTDPNFVPLLNRRLTIEHSLRNAGWEDTEIKLLLDTSNEGNEESVSRAAQAFKDIMAGKNPKRYLSADSAFGQYLIDRMDDEIPLDKIQLIEQYFGMHIPIIELNMARKAKMQSILLIQQQGQIPPNTQQPAMTQAPTSTPQQSSQISNQLTP